MISHLDGIQCAHIADGCKFLLVSQHWHVHVQRRTMLMSWSLLLHLTCFARLTWMGCEMGGKK